MSDYTKAAIQVWIAILISSAIGLSLMAVFSPSEPGSLADTVKTRIQQDFQPAEVQR